MSRGRVVFVIGPSGCGKTTLARALAASGRMTFLEGDAFHPPENVEAMRAGRPLTDEMRWGWLADVAAAAAQEADAGHDVVVACSGLKRAYRDRLRQGAGPCLMLFLDGPRDLVRTRLAGRRGHYMPAALLDSQYDTLERPGRDEADVRRIDISGSPRDMAAAANRVLATADAGLAPDAGNS